jgi:UDP-N-acetylmuramoylalanine--D-glutamate ligase
MDFLRDISVLVLGLGESGLACAQFAHRSGARLRVADTRANPSGLATVQALNGVHVVLGAFDEHLLDGVAHIVVSPGLSPYQTGVAELLAVAATRGISVGSELEWFMQAVACLPEDHRTVIAITGTNGKTTVTELTTHVCNEAGVKAVACGNISPAMLTALMAAMDAAKASETDQLPTVWVLELSSFQLHYTQTFNPRAAAVLNITQDHLDWHSHMAEYAADKAKVFGEDTLRVLNRDDAAVMALAAAKPAPQANASHKPTAAHSAAPAIAVRTFGLSAPQHAGDMGCVTEGSLNWLSMAVASEAEKKRRKADPIETHTQRLMPADALRIRGSHNHANAQAALLLALAAGVPIAKALHGLRSYAGAPNRCELVAVLNDVEYINDSKGTNVGATVAALHGLGEGRQRLVLIAGGVGKGQDFSPLRAAVGQHCTAVVTIGQAAGEIAAALADCGVALHHAGELVDAVRMAAGLARTGDAVLLSPACASFDQFQHYAHRAQVFIDAVQALPMAGGAV